jgi:hypothetical protein
MSQDSDRDQNGSHPRPDGNEGSEQRLNREEILLDSKTNPTVLRIIGGLEACSQQTYNALQLLLQGLIYLLLSSGRELCGPARNGKVGTWANLLSINSGLTVMINAVFAWDFFKMVRGPIQAVVILVVISAIANLSIKLACHRPRPGRLMTILAMVYVIIFQLVPTVPTPIAEILHGHQLDLANQRAHVVFQEQVLAPEQSRLDAVLAVESDAEEAEGACQELMDQVQLKKEQNLPYDQLFNRAEGKWIPNYQLDKQWEGTPIENRPVCPQGRALRQRVNAEKDAAEAAVRDAWSHLYSTYGDSYLDAVKHERPELYEMYFDESGRIRSRQQEIDEAIRFMFTSNAGVKAIISVPTILSVVASVLLVLMLWCYISDLDVQRSWDSRAALNQRNRIRRTFDGGNGHGQ